MRLAATATAALLLLIVTPSNTPAPAQDLGRVLGPLNSILRGAVRVRPYSYRSRARYARRPGASRAAIAQERAAQIAQARGAQMAQLGAARAAGGVLAGRVAGRFRLCADAAGRRSVGAWFWRRRCQHVHAAAEEGWRRVGRAARAGARSPRRPRSPSRPKARRLQTTRRHAARSKAPNGLLAVKIAQVMPTRSPTGYATRSRFPATSVC